MPSVEIVEVSPRDGLQSETVRLSTAEKVELIGLAVAAGASRVEAASFVNPKRVPQMADAEDVMRLLPRLAGVSYIGLALNERGAERAVAAECDEVNFVVVASETFSQRNQGAGVAETLDRWARVAAVAKAAGRRTSVTIAAAFGCPFEGEVELDQVASIVERLADGDTAPDEISLADTIGVAVPPQITAAFDAARRIAPAAKLRGHFHNTRNTGLANAFAAQEAGAQALDASLGGIGGCPFAPAATGNIPTEDLVYLLERSGICTGLDLQRAIEAAQWLGDKLGKRVPGMLEKAGPFPAAA